MDVVGMIEVGAFLGLCALLLLRCQVWTFGNDISIGILPHSLPGVEYPGTFCSCLGILLAVTGNMPLYNPLVIGRLRMGIDGGSRVDSSNLALHSHTCTQWWLDLPQCPKSSTSDIKK